MTNAIERLTLLKEFYEPDYARRRAAAEALLVELTRVAHVALWEVVKLGAVGLELRMPANFRNGVRIVVVDGHIHGFDALKHSEQRTADVLKGLLEYDPLQSRFVGKEKTRAVDVIADAIAKTIEGQVPGAAPPSH